MFKSSLPVSCVQSLITLRRIQSSIIQSQFERASEFDTEPPRHLTGFEVGGPPSPEPVNGEPTARCSSHERSDEIFGLQERSIALVVGLSARLVRPCWGIAPIGATAPELSPPKPHATSKPSISTHYLYMTIYTIAIRDKPGVHCVILMCAIMTYAVGLYVVLV